MDKYYTPTIEEFYVGFECEIKNNADAQKRFNTFVLDNTYLQIALKIKLSDIRVKYLDKEDIESLGWEFDSNISYPNSTNFIKKIKNTEGVYLYYNPLKKIAEKGVYIEIYESNKDNTWFAGFIKNKSELKKLLNQLNIKYDN